MKAILVIDIPDDIWANKEEDMGMYAEVWSKRIDDGWCGEYYADSLKPMPQKKEDASDFLSSITIAVLKGFNEGYNTCIDEILGAEE